MKQKMISFGGPVRRSPQRADRTVTGNRKRLRKRRTGRQTLNHLFVFLVASLVFLTLSLTVFFRIEQIEVTGCTKYADEEIIQNSGIKIGDNLFRVSEKNVRNKLTQQYPYVEDVQLKRNLPMKLTIEITQAKPLGAVDTAAGYVIIGRNGKVLEFGSDTLSEDMMIVSGMYLYDPQIGHVLGQDYNEKDMKDEMKAEIISREQDGFRMLTNLVEAVEETGFDKVTLVDLSDRLNMVLVYDNRVLVELGVESDLEYKLNFVQYVITQELDAGFEGIVDASGAASSKEVWTDPADITAELEQMRINAQQKEEQEEQSQGYIPPASENPELATIPGTAPSSSSAASGISSSSGTAVQETSSSQAESSSSIDELATIPNEERTESQTQT